MRIAQQRLTEVLRLSGEENSLVAHGGAAAHLRNCGGDVPERIDVMGSRRRASAAVAERHSAAGR